MSLVPCRACGHQVDTSALACPGCGATDPGHKISRQERDLRLLLVQLVIGVAILGGGVMLAWGVAGPILKQLGKPQTEVAGKMEAAPIIRAR